MSIVPVTLVFPRERMVFLKEESTKLYSTFTFFMSRTIIELPFTIIIPMLTSLITYWMIGLESNAAVFFTFYLTLFLVVLAGSSLGLLIGSMFENTRIVTVVTPVVILPFILFSGLFKNRNELPVWLGWIEYLSPIKYSFTSMTRN